MNRACRIDRLVHRTVCRIATGMLSEIRLPAEAKSLEDELRAQEFETVRLTVPSHMFSLNSIGSETITDGHLKNADAVVDIFAHLDSVEGNIFSDLQSQHKGALSSCALLVAFAD